MQRSGTAQVTVRSGLTSLPDATSPGAGMSGSGGWPASTPGGVTGMSTPGVLPDASVPPCCPESLGVRASGWPVAASWEVSRPDEQAAQSSARTVNDRAMIAMVPGPAGGPLVLARGYER